MADAVSIFKVKFKNYISSLKSTSYDEEHKEYLCNDESQKVFNFDLIIKDMYPQKQPASYDALLIQDKNIYCIEFKNEKYSNINKIKVHKKLINGKDVLNDIFTTNHIPSNEYNFIFCVAYKNTEARWRRGIEKNTIQFELEQYKGKYFDEIYTNDVQYFTNEYKKHFYEELQC